MRQSIARNWSNVLFRQKMTLNYIPPYCPWYNPVEYAFSNIKRVFRRQRLISDDFDRDVHYCHATSVFTTVISSCRNGQRRGVIWVSLKNSCLCVDQLCYRAGVRRDLKGWVSVVVPHQHGNEMDPEPPPPWRIGKQKTVWVEYDLIRPYLLPGVEPATAGQASVISVGDFVARGSGR
jgi:hypothetical protein